ncbi:MAG: galactose-1-phosphate uridylyltransferase [Candidatus Lokiarchaeia archaeon]
MGELRYNPVLGEWIIVSGKRKDRPLLPSGGCPFCPGSPEVPSADWDVLSLPNKFPSLVPEPDPPEIEGDEFYRVAPAQGICEVVLYTPEHNTSLADLTVSHIKKIVDHWAERCIDLGDRDYVKYVFIFENKGRVIGVTLDHPHGQIYAFPFTPPRIEKELESSKNFYDKNKECLFCKINEREKKDKVRVIVENDDHLAFLPFYAKWPFGAHIHTKRHVQSLPQLNSRERDSLAQILKEVLMTFDKLFDFSFPYIMALHQQPTDGNNYEYYHFHIEFSSPIREKEKLKFFAGVEESMGTVTFDYRPEDKAEELRKAHAKIN